MDWPTPAHRGRPGCRVWRCEAMARGIVCRTRRRADRRWVAISPDRRGRGSCRGDGGADGGEGVSGAAESRGPDRSADAWRCARRVPRARDERFRRYALRRGARSARHRNVRSHARTRDAPDGRTSRRPDAPSVVPPVHVEGVSADASLYDRDRCGRRAGGHAGACMSGRPAVFLDRDGTIIEEVGYLDRVERVQLFPWSVAAIRALNTANIPIVLITNQSGVARGFFTESIVDD